MPTPNEPAPLPPDMSPAAEEVERQAASGGLGDAVAGVADLVGDAVDAGDVVVSAAEVAGEVGGEVLGGALEALGSGLEVAGGCAEGCSFVLAVVTLLAAAGAALALGWY